MYLFVFFDIFSAVNSKLINDNNNNNNNKTNGKIIIMESYKRIEIWKWIVYNCYVMKWKWSLFNCLKKIAVYLIVLYNDVYSDFLWKWICLASSLGYFTCNVSLFFMFFLFFYLTASLGLLCKTYIYFIWFFFFQRYKGKGELELELEGFKCSQMVLCLVKVLDN